MGRPPRKRKETCSAPRCANEPTQPPYVRFVTVIRRGKQVHLHVCRGCYSRHSATGSFKRRMNDWSSHWAEIVRLRREGLKPAEIERRFGGEIPRRSIYGILAAHGLRARAG